MPEVIDAWYDSGSMPFAQWGYPWVEGSTEKFEQAYPADFISEAIDQTRGWFYTLMAIGTLVFDESSYRNVVCLGHIMAEDGRKMSKHLGNILEPIPLMDDHSADAVRWFMACLRLAVEGARHRAERAERDRPEGAADLLEHGRVPRAVRPARPTGRRRPTCRRWRSARCWTAGWSARRTGWSGTPTRPTPTSTPSRLGSLISSFVDVLSNWYVRRSRRRFWAGDAGALATLHETLDVLTRLMAPLTPFVTERVWQDVFRPVTPGPAGVGAPDQRSRRTTRR